MARAARSVSSNPPDLSDLSRAHHGTADLRRSAQIVPLRPFDPVAFHRAVVDAAPELLRLAFPATSRWGMCVLAGRNLGVSPDTILRLSTGGTGRADLAILAAAARHYRAQTGRDHAIAAMLLCLLGVQ